MTANVVADASPTDPEVYIPLDPTVVDTVPLLFVDGIGILDDKALNRIIKPAIQEINGWEQHNGWYWWYRNLRYNWDSWFCSRSERFKYNGGEIYHAKDLNYIVGGHAFKHYGISEGLMMKLYYLHKGQPDYEHKPGDPVLEGSIHWMFIGYYGYSGRSRW